MKNLYLLLISLLTVVTGTAQTILSTDSTEKSMQEVVISASKFLEKRKNIAQKIDVITARTIATVRYAKHR